jgi:glycosyltransferase involved in cell wall biosynthesis
MYLKILIVVTNADLAGAPIHVRDLALHLHQQGHAVHVVFGENGPVRDHLQAEGIATDCVPTLRSNIHPLQDIASWRALIAIARRVQPDVLHLHSSKAGLVGRLVAWRLGLPAVYTVHGWGFGPGRRWHVALFVRLTEWVCRPFTRRYIAVSNADKRIGERALALNADRIVTIHNGSAFAAKPNVADPQRLSLIMVARNDHPKDYPTFFKALARAEFDEATVVGHGTDSPRFIAQARELLGDKVEQVKFLGARSDVESLLEQANVMVLSSRFEGLPISLIEGMSKGLVLLGSRVGGVLELVEDGVNGWLFDVTDDLQLARHIGALRGAPLLRQRMGEAALSRFKADFELDAMVSKTLDQYRLACFYN